MKRNLNMPGFKLKHMNTPLFDKKPLPEARKEKTPVKPTNILTADKKPSFLHNNGVVSSSGGEVNVVDNDSLRSVQAFKDEVKNYMDRKFKGNNPQLGSITPEENFREAMGELSGKYFDLERGKLRGYPTDDAEMIDEKFKSKLKSYKIFNPEMFSDKQPKDE